MRWRTRKRPTPMKNRHSVRDWVQGFSTSDLASIVVEFEQFEVTNTLTDYAYVRHLYDLLWPNEEVRISKFEMMATEAWRELLIRSDSEQARVLNKGDRLR